MRMWEYDLQYYIEQIFDLLRQFPDALDDVLDIDPRSIPDVQRLAYKTYLTNPANAANPVITQGLIRETPVAEMITIVLAGSSETRQDIGQFNDDYSAGDSPTDVIGSGSTTSWAATFRHEYNIVCHSANADLVIWMQKIVLYAMILARHPLDHAGFLDMRIGGGDFMPEPDWIPPFIYSRAVTISGEVTEVVRLDTPLGVIGSIVVTNQQDTTIP